MSKFFPNRRYLHRIADRGTRLREQQLAQAADYFDWRQHQQRKHRADTLKVLRRDDQFIIYTERLKRSLREFRKANPLLFDRFFRRFTPLTLLDRSHVKRLLTELGDGKARRVFGDYVRYASRFKVRMIATARTFRPQPFDPPDCTFRARIVDGHLAPFKEKESPESIYELLFLDREIDVVPELATLMRQGQVKFFSVHDSKGGSLLNEIEYFTYQPSGLTFVVHHAQHPRIYLLIGENVSTDTLLRSAGKVVTALQRKLFSRKKSGRRTDLQKLQKAIRVAQKELRPKQQAFEMARSPGASREFDTGARYMRRVKARLATVPSKQSAPH